MRPQNSNKVDQYIQQLEQQMDFPFDNQHWQKLADALDQKQTPASKTEAIPAPGSSSFALGKILLVGSVIVLIASFFWQQYSSIASNGHKTDKFLNISQQSPSSKLVLPKISLDVADDIAKPIVEKTSPAFKRNPSDNSGSDNNTILQVQQTEESSDEKSVSVLPEEEMRNEKPSIEENRKEEGLLLKDTAKDKKKRHILW
jgi:hypothetical protein